MIDELQFLKAVPSAQDRILIDMVNGLDVTRDHIRVGKNNRASIASRLLGAVTGETQLRNLHIDQGHQLALDGAVAAIFELVNSQVRSNFAIKKVADRLKYVEASLAETAHRLVDISEVVDQLRLKIDDQLILINDELSRLDLRAAASEQLELLMSRWQAGQFNDFPRSSRCFIVAHELYWGAYGEYMRLNPGSPSATVLKQTFQVQALIRLSQSIDDDDAVPLSVWLSYESNLRQSADVFTRGLAYLGSHFIPNVHPWSYTLSQLPVVNDAPKAVPHYCSAKVMSQRFTREFCGWIFSAAEE